MKSPYTGIKRIIKAFSYSTDGLKAAFKSEAAFRQDILFCLIMTPICLYFATSGIEKAFLIFSLILILLAELINTAIETIIDRISQDYHILSKKAKDIGSLIVLLAFVNFFTAAVLILF